MEFNIHLGNLFMAKRRGAGGTSGGIGQFFLGLLMMGCGFYLLLGNIIVSSGFLQGGMLHWTAGNVIPFSGSLNSGVLFIPMMAGIAFIFYNGRSSLGWFLFVIPLIAMIVGVIATLSIRIQSMTAFSAIVIFTLAFGGLGLFLKSLLPTRDDDPDDR